MPKDKIKLIIWDAYGPILSAGYPDTFKVLSKRYKVPEKKLMEVIYKKYFNLAAVRKITQKQAWDLSVKELGLPITGNQLRDLHMGLFSANKNNLKLVKELNKSYKTLMLSKNTRSQFAGTKKKFPHVWKAFNKVINTWELGLPKGSKKTMLEISRRFKVKPTEMIFIDDQEVNLEEAKAMGVKTIFYQNDKQLRKDLKKYIDL